MLPPLQVEGLIHFKSGVDQGEYLDSSIQDMCQARTPAGCHRVLIISCSTASAVRFPCSVLMSLPTPQTVNEILDVMVSKNMPVAI